MSNIVDVAKMQLEKEHRRLTINLDRAKERKGVTAKEIHSLQSKIDVNLFLQERTKDRNTDNVYVLTLSCYSGDGGTFVYRNRADAYQAMLEDYDTEMTNLRNQGYTYVSSKDNNYAEVYVPDSDIYFEWYIVPCEVM